VAPAAAAVAIPDAGPGGALTAVASATGFESLPEGATGGTFAAGALAGATSFDGGVFVFFMGAFPSGIGGRAAARGVAVVGWFVLGWEVPPGRLVVFFATRLLCQGGVAKGNSPIFPNSCSTEV
jgi:hypothetical protein